MATKKPLAGILRDMLLDRFSGATVADSLGYCEFVAARSVVFELVRFMARVYKNASEIHLNASGKITLAIDAICCICRYLFCVLHVYIMTCSGKDSVGEVVVPLPK